MRVIRGVVYHICWLALAWAALVLALTFSWGFIGASLSDQKTMIIAAFAALAGDILSERVVNAATRETVVSRFRAARGDGDGGA
jgi:apolipoprotein N-acyltransferase